MSDLIDQLATDRIGGARLVLAYGIGTIIGVIAIAALLAAA